MGRRQKTSWQNMAWKNVTASLPRILLFRRHLLSDPPLSVCILLPGKAGGGGGGEAAVGQEYAPFSH